MTAPEQLQGRELERAVAEAMGWTDCKEGQRGLYANHPRFGRCRVPRYTDGESQSELIAWLTRRQDHLDIDCWAKGNDGKPGASAVLSVDGSWTSSYVEGSSINEALCRLVLAVSKQATGAP